MRKAVSGGGVVIACAYGSHVPEGLRAQLPDGGYGAFVARIVDGRVEKVAPGLPEQAVLTLLPAAAERP